MPNLDRILLTKLLPMFISRACPSSVPRSGNEGAQINCFTTTVREGDEPNLVLLSMSGEEVKCLRYDGNRYSIDATVRITEIDPQKVHLTHYYGVDEIQYVGIWSISRGLLTRWPYILIHLRRAWDAFAQRLFNRRSLVAQRRIDILREILKATTNGSTSVDALSLMDKRYGDRWARHPEWEAHHNHLNFVLELLAESGELQGSYRDGYRLTGQALKFLDECEESDRKHVANFRLQVVLVLITLILAVMAAVQSKLLKFPVLIDLTR